MRSAACRADRKEIFVTLSIGGPVRVIPQSETRSRRPAIARALLTRRHLARFAAIAAVMVMLGFGPLLGTARAASHSITIRNRSSTVAWIVVSGKFGDYCDADAYYT